MGASRISGHELQRASRGMQAAIAKGTKAACERELQRVPRGHMGTNSNGRQRSTQAGIAMDAKVTSDTNCNEHEGAPWAEIVKGANGACEHESQQL